MAERPDHVATALNRLTDKVFMEALSERDPASLSDLVQDDLGLAITGRNAAACASSSCSVSSLLMPQRQRYPQRVGQSLGEDESKH